MKTLHAPDSLPALFAAVQDAALASPVLAFAVLVAACAAFAAYAARAL